MNTDAPSHAPAWMRPFTRVTSRGDYLPEIDGLRFFALLGVFLLHLNHAVLNHSPQLASAETSTMTRVLECGASGVQLFFAISGFILALPFARAAMAGGKPVSLKAYFFRRLTRLEPPLIINVTLALLLKTLLLGRSMSELLPHYFATCTYTHYLCYGEVSPINGVTWSLEVEAQFYITMPLLALVFTIPSKMTRRSIIVLGMIVSGVIGRHVPYVFLPAQLSHFLAGFLLADLWLNEWKEGRALSIKYDLLALLSAAALLGVLYFNRQLPLSGVMFPLLIFSAAFCALKGQLMMKFLRFWVTGAIGGMCYTFYLYHVLLLALIGRALAKWITTTDHLHAYLLYLVIAAPILLVVSFMLFATTERPFMKWRPLWARR
jgi:peptidoglycan/LPS O-acetylase OafA/YrhL